MKKDKIIFLFLITISGLLVLYFDFYVHEYGHYIAHKTLFNASCSFNFNKIETRYSTTHQLECIIDETKFTEGKRFITKLAGYGLEILIASLLLLTPISILGGAWFINIGIDVLFYNNRITSDLYFLDFWVKLLIALIMVFLFFVSVYLQRLWIFKFIRRKG